MGQKSKIRLFVDAPLGEGQAVALTQGQVHYLAHVMRRVVDDPVVLFNGRDGEWSARLSLLRKRDGIATCDTILRDQTQDVDLWLLFAPVKKARTDYIVEKATEMGVSRIQPVVTQFTNSDRIRVDRMEAIAKEAAEQSERLTVPKIGGLMPLAKAMDDWPDGRTLIFADEARDKVQSEMPPLPAAVLIGPEGGFSDEERKALYAHPNCHGISLGPRILRADTAVVAALAQVQMRIGDWQ